MTDGHIIVATRGRGAEALLVQADLAGSKYRFDIKASRADCAWEIQTVLNSVPSGAAPRAPRLDLKLPAPVSITSQATVEFDVSAVGVYSVDYQIVSAGPSPCPFDLRLLGPGFLIQPIAAGDSGGSGANGIVMLSPGRWRVAAGTSCAWIVRVAPRSEDGGGRTLGF
jgi:hypothetical protein